MSSQKDIKQEITSNIPSKTIEDIVSYLKRRKEKSRDDRGAILFVGAGCSNSNRKEGDVPLARTFIEEIKKDYNDEYLKASRDCDGDPNYQKCMQKLSPAERYELIYKFTKDASVNWAHIAIAMLLKCGFVKRILTTNFDPLIIKACALINEFPAIYDCASTNDYTPDNVPDKAVFYLQGMHNGFLQNHTDKESLENKFIRRVIQTESIGRPWIVVGYSGESDPVIEHLVDHPKFSNFLYWICYKDKDPAKYVRENLITESKFAFIVKNDYNADKFFVELAQKLDCFHPEFIDKPFTYVKQFVEPLKDLEFPGDGFQKGMVDQSLEMIDSAITDIEVKTEKVNIIAKFKSMLAAGKFIDVEKEATKSLLEKYKELNSIRAVALFNIGIGITIESDSDTVDIEESKTLLYKANKLYDETILLVEDFYPAYCEIGKNLIKIANKDVNNSSKLQLLHDAKSKFESSINIRNDFFMGHYELGIVNTEIAMLEDNINMKKYLEDSIQNFKKAIEINDRYVTAYFNCGNAFNKLGHIETEKKYMDERFNHSIIMFKKAIEIDPLFQPAYEAWGNSLMELGKREQNPGLRIKIFNDAISKFKEVLNIDNNAFSAYIGWGGALSEIGKDIKHNEEKQKTFGEAMDILEKALKISPESYHIYVNLGCTLINSAYVADGSEVNSGNIEKAETYLLIAESLEKGSGSYNLACIYSIQHNEEKCRDYLDRAKTFNFLPYTGHLSIDKDLENMRDKEWFKEFLESLD